MTINTTQLRNHIVSIMQEKGYWDVIMSAPVELDRVKIFLSRLAGQSYPEENISPRILPTFPGLNHRAVHDPNIHAWTQKLIAHYPAIQKEFNNLSEESNFLDYNTNDALSAGSWDILAFYYNGIVFPEIKRRCPVTFELIDNLPRHCQRYPYGVAVFSKLHPGSHIAPHRSIDNLRVRTHLGLKIPEGCRMRVDKQMLHWKEGYPIYFEDYFEHEVWHNGNDTRVVLIVDNWHPDLTDLEIEALTAAFRHPAIMMLLHQTRKTPFPSGSALEQYFVDAFQESGGSDLHCKYWH